MLTAVAFWVQSHCSESVATLGNIHKSGRVYVDHETLSGFMHFWYHMQIKLNCVKRTIMYKVI